MREGTGLMVHSRWSMVTEAGEAVMEHESTFGYEQLEVHRRSFALVKPLHQLVARFPDVEKFDLANQMRRACKSIPANIAEGHGRRKSPKEFCHFLTVALGSSNEMRVHFAIALELEYVTQLQHDTFAEEYRIIGRQLAQLIRYWTGVQQKASRN